MLITRQPPGSPRGPARVGLNAKEVPTPSPPLPVAAGERQGKERLVTLSPGRRERGLLARTNTEREIRGTESAPGSTPALACTRWGDAHSLWHG